MEAVSWWLEWYRRFWIERLNALGAELVRGRRDRRENDDAGASADRTSNGKEETTHD